MTRLNIFLSLVLVASALLLVRTSYESRRLFAANQRADAEAVRIEQEFKRLDAQRQLNATHQRVAQDAEQRLKMRKDAPRFEVFESATSAGARP
jgi:cell division protein FtsL